MITSETDFRKWVQFEDQEALEHDTEFMTAALERAGTYRWKQGLYGSRSSEDIEELRRKIWQAGMRREWAVNTTSLNTSSQIPRTAATRWTWR